MCRFERLEVWGILHDSFNWKFLENDYCVTQISSRYTNSELIKNCNSYSFSEIYIVTRVISNLEPQIFFANSCQQSNVSYGYTAILRRQWPTVEQHVSCKH